MSTTLSGPFIQRRVAPLLTGVRGETVWKFSDMGQAPHHQADHGCVDERFCASTKPLVVLAHPPVLIQPGGWFAPPPTCGVEPHNPSRRHQPLPVHLLALLGPLPGPPRFATSSGTGLGGLRTTSTLKPNTSSAHLLPLPSYPASSHRCFRRESPPRADCEVGASAHPGRGSSRCVPWP